jgi:hypothetical protein
VEKLFFKSNLSGKRKYVLGFILILGAFSFQSCNDSNFSGTAGKTGARVGPPGCKNPPCDGKPKPPVSLDMEFSGDKKIEPIQNTKIWTATTNGIITRLTIDGDRVTDRKTWMGGAGKLGIRTYVTEGGFIGARSPWLYFVDPDKQQTIAKSKNLGIDSELRICVASYMKNGQRFMIAAWGNGSFHEYAMDDKPPYAPKWEDPPTKSKTLGTGMWGYSCFIDQQQKIFYSQNHTAGKVVGVNLTNYEAVKVSVTAPNATFESRTAEIKAFTKGEVKTSYAMSGDSYGNIYNGAGYTSAYDKASDSVWFSGGGSIMVIDRKCLTTEPNCSNWHRYTNLVSGSILPPIGPMSALKDGRIVGVVNDSPNPLTGTGGGDIYLMNLRNKSDLKSGLEGVRVANAGGRPYMYTDFTGATLYITESEQDFKPVDMEGYSASKPIKTAVFKWKPTLAYAAGGLSVEWRNIKLEARCYSNAASKPAFVEVVKVHPSDKGTELNVPSCVEGKYSKVDVKLSQLNNDSSLVGIDTISVGFKQ